MNKIKRIVIVSFGVIFMLYGLIMPFVAPFSVGLVPIYVFAAVLIAYGFFFNRCNKAVHISFLCFFAVIIAVLSGLAVYGNNDNVSYNEDALIVLGKGLDGDKVTTDLASRLDTAIEYHKKNSDALIVVSGGQGNNERISEAMAMERYLKEKGIPSEKIIKEDKSTSTYENFLFSTEILDEKLKEDYSVAFITNDFHVYRAERLAKSVGVEAAHLGADIEWYTVPTNYLREIMALIKLLVFKMT